MANKFFHIDYEANRTTGLLLGLIFSLTLLYVALEYRTGGGDYDDFDSDDDTSVADMELLPQQQRKDMIAYIKPGETPKAVTEKIKKVEETVTEVPKVDQPAGDAENGKDNITFRRLFPRPLAFQKGDGFGKEDLPRTV